MGNNETGQLPLLQLTILVFNPTFNYVSGKTFIVVAGEPSCQFTSGVNAVVTLDPIYPQQIIDEQRKDPMWNRV